MGQGKSPWYTHRLMHRKRVTSELHDSYFRLMTIKHAIPKIERAIEWAIELLYNSVWTGSQWVGDQRSRSREVVEKATARRRGPWGPWLSWRSDELVIRCGRKSHHPAEGALGSPSSFDDPLVIRCGRESQQKAEPPGLWLSIRRTRTTHGYVRRGWRGQYVAVFVWSPTPSHTQTLQIKWEVYFFEEVFDRSFIIASICIQHIYVLCIYVYVLCVCIVNYGHGYTTYWTT